MGNLLWLTGRPIPEVVLWWANFLILTIVGERLELNRLLRLSAAKRAAFLIGIALLLVGTVLATWVAYGLGVRVVGWA